MEETIKQLSAYFFYTIPLVLGTVGLLSIIERVVPTAGPRKPGKGYFLNIRVQLLTMLIGAIFAGTISGASIATVNSFFGKEWIDLSFHMDNGVLNVILTFLLATFIVDFFGYWLHRFQHEFYFLWQQHKLHHMDEQLCAAYRVHWLEPFFGAIFKTTPVAIFFKLNALESGILGFVSFAWVAFYHSNIRLHLGPLSMLFTGPQLHRIHHSRERKHHDQNYAGFFPLWDVIFGTYYHPSPDEYPPTGVEGEKDVETFLEALTLPFREWWKMLGNKPAKKAQ